MNIQNLINPLMLLAIKDNKVILRETENKDKEMTLEEVIITSLPAQTIAYSTDLKVKDPIQKDRKLYNEYLCVPSPSLVKKEGEGYFWIDEQQFYPVEFIDKRSDGVIICKNENQFSVIICDLKSKKFNLKDCSDKFMTDKLFLDYLVSILNVIFKEHITIGIIKYVIFYLQTGLESKPSPRTTKADLLKIEEDNMIGYNEKILKIPFDKKQHNYIEWDKIVNFNVSVDYSL
jgi:hypothetical protein